MVEWLKPGVNVFVTGPRNNYVGEFVGIVGSRLVELKNAVWVSESGRYLSTFMAEGRADGMEVEPMGTHSIRSFDDIDLWPHPLFTERE